MSKNVLKHEIISFIVLQIPLLTLFLFQSKILIFINTPMFQFATLLLVIFINWLVFVIAHNTIKKVSNHYYCFNFVLTVACFALAGFSQEELVKFGFIFTDDREGIYLYFMYKTLFNVVGFYNLPKALRLFINREKLIELIKRT